MMWNRWKIFEKNKFQFPDVGMKYQPCMIPRLIFVMTFYIFFCCWDLFCKSNKALMMDNKHMFITSECFEDLKSSILGLIEFDILNLPDHPITPHLMKSDICKNHFRQRWTIYNGVNTNPDALGWGGCVVCVGAGLGEGVGAELGGGGGGGGGGGLMWLFCGLQGICTYSPKL